MPSDEVVSSEAEQLILVDHQDREIGYSSKADCHDGGGVLHRAFSLFIFNADGELLVQQRSAQKRLWPLYWSNSCCSHPRRDESMETATQRRLAEELGLEADLRYLYKFTYQARYAEVGSEHEYCWVYAGRAHGEVRVNSNEIAAWRYVPAGQLDREMAATPENFTPWFKLEWGRIKQDHSAELAAL